MSLSPSSCGLVGGVGLDVLDLVHAPLAGRGLGALGMLGHVRLPPTAPRPQPPPLVPPTPVLRLGMAVRAQEPQVLEPVVVPAPVYVVELKHKRSAALLVPAALLAGRGLQAKLDQPELEMISIARSGKQRLQGHRLGPGANGAAEPSVVKGLERKPEA